MTTERANTGSQFSAVAGDPTLAEIINRLIEAYRPELIYLVDSRARGPAGPESDYDLLVVVPDDALPAQRRSGRAYEAPRASSSFEDRRRGTRGPTRSEQYDATSSDAAQ